jgi:hypothetical protein
LQSFTPDLLDGPVHLAAKFRWFRKDLDRMAAELGVDEGNLSFRDLATIMRRWLYLQMLAE